MMHGTTNIKFNEIYLLIKDIKSVLWRVAKRLPYIEDARCLKVKKSQTFQPLALRTLSGRIRKNYETSSAETSDRSRVLHRTILVVIRVCEL